LRRRTPALFAEGSYSPVQVEGPRAASMVSFVRRHGEHWLLVAVPRLPLGMLQRGEFQSRSTELGERLHGRLRALIGHGVVAVRGMGLWAGVDIDPTLATGKQISLKLAERGVLVKDTHGSTLRFAPPLVITAEEIDWAISQFADVLAETGSHLSGTEI